MRLSEPAVSVIRGKWTESLHRGHIAVVDSDSRILYSLGDPNLATYARSSAKPLQAIPVVESGAMERFGFSEEELALMCASHNGEAGHVGTAASMLAKMGLTPESLRCGAHAPFHKPTADRMKTDHVEPTALHNNCSGKHAGMLALARMLDVPTDGYPAPEHPVQRMMLQTVSEMSGVPEDRIRLGTDGCGVPVFGLPLASLAAAFARLGEPHGLPPARAEACRRIVGAIRRHPFHLAGSKRFDTRLAQVTGGRVIGKMGAEGVFAATVPDKGWGFAVKIEDGAERALYPAVAETLRQLDLLSSSELKELESFHVPALKNWQGVTVGRIQPSFNLRQQEG